MAWITPLANGRFKVGWRVNGDCRYHTVDNVTQAKALKSLKEVDELRGEVVDPKLSRQTVEGWADRWMNSLSVEPGTVKWYRNKVENHIKPRFGKTPISHVDQADVKEWLAEMHRAGRSYSHRHGCLTTLSQVMGFAVGARARRDNPCIGIRLSREQRREKIYLVPAEIDRLAAALGPTFATLARFAPYSGLRPGEWTGLRRSRLHLERGIAVVAETFSDGRWGPVKTHQSRTVQLPRQVVQELTAFLAERPGAPDDPVFSMPQGGIIHESNFVKRYFQPAVKASKVDARMRPYDWRHSFASMCISAGLEPQDVMVAMGHESITTTMREYGSLWEERKRVVGSALENLIDNSTDLAKIVAIR